MATKLSVNIRTLLFNCEELAKNETNHWRLKKFIKSMDKMIEELDEYADPQTISKKEDFKQRLQALKTLINYVELPKAHNGDTARQYSSNLDVLKEIQQLQSGQQYGNVRKELLSGGEDTLRYRSKGQGDQSNVSSDKLGEAIKYHNQTQEKITEHMLSLTSHLKGITESANRIIKQDTEVVSNSTRMSDQNLVSLEKEGKNLEAHSRNAWRCWLWLMICFVVCTFIGMVIFMKIVKKRY